MRVEVIGLLQEWATQGDGLLETEEVRRDGTDGVMGGKVSGQRLGGTW